MSTAAPMTLETDWPRTHLAVPRADGTLLVRPGFEEAAAAARDNAVALDDLDIDVQGRPFSALRRRARAEAIELARRFTAERLGDTEADADPTAPLVVTGHQPALFHPGVWSKNFAAAGIASRLGGGALNLVVDNDLCSRPSIDAPAGARDEPRREPIAFDAPGRPLPWEDAGVRDATVFRSFGDRAAAHMRRWGIAPLVAGRWDDARLASGPLSERFTAFRHGIEADWGLRNLELPMSGLCGTEAFGWFAGHLLAHLPRFALIYNAALDEYRGVHRIKSRNHPVPALETRGVRLEAPFWVWTQDAPRRRRVFARQTARRIELSDDSGAVFASFPLAPDMDACCAADVLRSLPAKGIRFRTRALTTTLFARLFLADTFVHGIGGAKYDEMTDRIAARFFGLPAPAFATVSASLFLPFAAPFGVTAGDESRLLGLLRDLDENPQRHLTAGLDPRLDALLAEKAALVAEQDAAWQATGLSRRDRRRRSAANRSRFLALREVTRRLAAFVDDQRGRVRRELEEVRAARVADRILASREFPFALYPEAKLRPFLTGLTDG